MGGLTQRFQANRGERGLNRVSVTARRTQQPGQVFKCVQPGLAKPFPFFQQPVVIPVGQQVADQAGQRYRIQVRWVMRAPLLVEATRECDQITNINIGVDTDPEER